jgi:hypothetical protein
MIDLKLHEDSGNAPSAIKHCLKWMRFSLFRLSTEIVALPVTVRPTTRGAIPPEVFRPTVFAGMKKRDNSLRRRIDSRQIRSLFSVTWRASEGKVFRIIVGTGVEKRRHDRR